MYNLLFCFNILKLNFYDISMVNLVIFITCFKYKFNILFNNFKYKFFKVRLSKLTVHRTSTYFLWHPFVKRTISIKNTRISNSIYFEYSYFLKFIFKNWTLFKIYIIIVYIKIYMIGLKNVFKKIKNRKCRIK